jgi:uncharacterized protein (TIGR03435 family)
MILIIAVVVAFVFTKKTASGPKTILTSEELSRISDPFEKSKAVSEAVSDLITSDAKKRGEKLPSKKELDEENKKIENLYEMFWRQAPAGAVIQPTHLTNGSLSSWYRENQITEMNAPFTTVLGAAYRTNGRCFPAARMVFVAKMPSGNFDLLLNDSNQDEKSLQFKIRKQFGLAGRLELRETNVLVLKLKNRGALALKFGAVPVYDSAKSYLSVLTTPQLAEILEERFFRQPVLDKTGTGGTIYFFALPRDSNDLNLLKQNLLEQFGLELVPDKRPIEMLIVEKEN